MQVSKTDFQSRWLLASAFLVLILFPAITRLAGAQATETQQQPAPAQQPTDESAQTPEQRAQVLRQAQARIQARRQQRLAQIIQETYSHKYEGYFGGGYLRTTPGPVLQHLNEAAWNIGATDYIRPKLGITADFRGLYGTAYTGNNPYTVFKPSISQYTFLFGPQYRFYERPKWAISGNFLAGFAHGNFDTGTNSVPGNLIGLYPNGTVFSFSIGAPIDYNLSPGLAVRLTPLYLFTNYGSSVQNNLGFNAGVVYRWGKQ